jgi:hypothetical protein
MIDIYAAQHEGLVGVHRALADAFAPIVDGIRTPLDVLIPQTRGAASFLLAHHEMESTGLFPGLRRHGHLRSTDVAFLDGCDREHHTLHALCEQLIAATGASHPSAATIANLARETMAVLTPHTREEEAGLAPDRLRLMIDEAGLTALGHELEAMRTRMLAKLSA